MRLKSYNAPTMAEAMRLVREELGEDAIIVSTQRSSDAQGVRITAALEEIGDDDDIQRALTGGDSTPFADKVREALEYHGAPARLVDKLVCAAQTVEVGSPTMACAAALEDQFDSAPLPERKSPRPFMLVGPPGSGKTITAAKLAARARLAGRPVGLITADTIRAGAVEQLTAFTGILEVELRQVRGADRLGLAVNDDADVRSGIHRQPRSQSFQPTQHGFSQNAGERHRRRAHSCHGCWRRRLGSRRRGRIVRRVGRDTPACHPP